MLGVLIGLFSVCVDNLYQSDVSVAEEQAYFEKNAVDLVPLQALAPALSKCFGIHFRTNPDVGTIFFFLRWDK